MPGLRRQAALLLSPNHLALTREIVSAKPGANLAVPGKSGRLLLRHLVPVPAFPHQGLWLVRGGFMGSPLVPPEVRVEPYSK